MILVREDEQRIEPSDETYVLFRDVILWPNELLHQLSCGWWDLGGRKGRFAD